MSTPVRSSGEIVNRSNVSMKRKPIKKLPSTLMLSVA